MTAERAGERKRPGELTLTGRIMPASNATFLGTIGETRVVYKPVAGERPLWDFPSGTLAGREYGAYLVSEALGWDIVPRTWLGKGPHGIGMVQEWQTVDEDQMAVTILDVGEPVGDWLAVFDGLDAQDRAVTLVHEDSEALRRMAIYDVITNNADRKGGHVLEMGDGHRYGVDHGLTLHHEHKLRTVLWGWGGSRLEDAERTGIEQVLTALEGRLVQQLSPHITYREIAELKHRCERLLQVGHLPEAEAHWPAIPWPPF